MLSSETVDFILVQRCSGGLKMFQIGICLLVVGYVHHSVRHVRHATAHNATSFERWLERILCSNFIQSPVTMIKKLFKSQCPLCSYFLKGHHCFGKPKPSISFIPQQFGSDHVFKKKEKNE